MAGYLSKGKNKTHGSFQKLGFEIGDIELNVNKLNEGMGRMQNTNELSQPEPNIPFVIATRNDVDGIYITVAVKIPDGTTTLRVILIRKADNVKLASDADDTAAIARAKRKSQHHRGRFQVSEDEAAAGSVEREIGPFKPKKNDSDQAYQLIRLVCLDDQGAFAFNPDENPFDVTEPFATGDTIFPALVVRDKYDAGDSGHTPGSTITDDADKRFFNVGYAVADIPSKPDVTLIVCNRAEMMTQAHKAEVQVKVFASDADRTKTFEEMAVDHCQAKFQRVSDPANSTNANINDHTFGGLVTDKTKTFEIIKCSLFVGVEYEWTKNITSNGTDRRPTPPVVPAVKFFAGGSLLLSALSVVPGLTPGTNVPGQSNDAKLQCIATNINVHHSLIQVRFQQPGTSGAAVECTPTTQGVIAKRVEIYEQLPGDAVPTIPLKSRSLLHKKKDFLPGALITEMFKAKHKARQTGIKYFAVLVGVGDDVTNVLTTFPTTVNSTLAFAPPDPIATDIVENIPDGDMSRHKARTTFRVWASLDARNGSGPNVNTTFRQMNVDHARIWLRRMKDFTADSASSDELTTHHAHHGGPIPDADLDTTSTLITVHEKHLGSKYRWDKNILVSHGVPAQSSGTQPAPGFVDFFAGYGAAGAYDPARLLNIDLTVSRINKRHSLVTVKFDQPPASGSSPGVLLKSVEIFQKLPADSAFIEIKHRAIHNKPGYSSNTSAGDLLPPLNTAIHKEVYFKVHHPPNLAGIQYYAIIRAVGNALVYAPTTAPAVPRTDTDTGDDKPLEMPTVPAYADIIQNTTHGEMGHGHARVTFRVYADWSRTKTFFQENADSAYVVLVDPGDPASGAGSERYKEGGPVTDVNATFVDITVKVLTVGKQYLWRRNITANGGGPQKSTIADVMFVAGGAIGTFGLPELSSTSLLITPVAAASGKMDSRHADVTLRFTQGPTGTIANTSSGITVRGTGTLFLAECPAGSYITVAGQTKQVQSVTSNILLTVMDAFSPNVSGSYTSSQVPVFLKRVEFFRSLNGGPFKEFKIRHLLHKQNYQTPGAKTIVVPVHHPKATPVVVQAIIYAVSAVAGQDGNNLTLTSPVSPATGNYTSADEKAFEDNGAPAGSMVASVRWNDNHLRVRFDLPVGAANNMNTHATNKLLLTFAINGSGTLYLWNPIARTTLLTSAPIDPITNPTQMSYLQDIGKTSHHSYNNKIPSSGPNSNKQIDMSNTTVYDAIFANGGVLTARCYVYNQFNNVLTGSLVATIPLGIPPGWSDSDMST